MRGVSHPPHLNDKDAGEQQCAAGKAERRDRFAEQQPRPDPRRDGLGPEQNRRKRERQFAEPVGDQSLSTCVNDRAETNQDKPAVQAARKQRLAEDECSGNATRIADAVVHNIAWLTEIVRRAKLISTR